MIFAKFATFFVHGEDVARKNDGMSSDVFTAYIEVVG